MNPKALNLDAVSQSQNKVTTGFRCDPQIKINLAEYAEDCGLTLSHYIEGIVTESVLGSDEEINIIRKRNSELEARLTLYETDILKKMLKDQKGNSFTIRDGEGKETVLKINDLPDVNLFIQYTFKISPDA